jgi:tripartite ATP-independent transporter DctP family solute receptor
MSKEEQDSTTRRALMRNVAALPLGLAFAGVGAAPAQAQSGVRGREGKTVTLKFGSSQPTHTENAHSVFFDAFIVELTSATNGEVGAIFYGDSQLGPEDKYPTAITFGTLDMMLTVSNWTTSVPELGVLTMGFLFPSMEGQGQVLDGNAGQQLQDIFARKTKAEILGWCYNFGGRNVLGKAPIRSLAEFRGKKLRVLPSPTFVQTFRLLGATPVPMSFSEIYTSLQTGVIDGLEHDPPTILQSKFYESAKNLTLTQHIFDPVAPIVSNAAMKRLSDSQQQAVRRAAAMAAKAQRPKAAAAAAAAMDELKRNGVQVIDIDRAPLVNAVKPLWSSFTDQHPDTKPVLAAILSATGQAS